MTAFQTFYFLIVIVSVHASVVSVLKYSTLVNVVLNVLYK